MALSTMNRITIISIIASILLQVVNCHLTNELQVGPVPVPAWDSLGHIEALGHSHADRNSTMLDQSTHSYRDPKFLSLFTVVQFANVDCTSSANGLMGTCYTFWDCMNGVSGDDINVLASVGSCMAGFGACCTSILGCGGSSNNNNTWLRSPGYPNTFNYGTDCKQTVTIDETICQLRLDIDDLTMNVPDSTGTCTTDYLTVNHDIKFDRLCGISKTNHFYLDVDYSSSSNVIFSFHTDSSTSYDRSWSIRVTKIVCDSPEEVPRGCGQYYTGTTGTIKGLNYEASSSEDYIISKLNYGICVRMELGYCQNTYTESTLWTTICPDIWEKPGRYDSLDRSTTNAKCVPSGQVVTAPTSQTYSYLTPHLFKLDTTRGTTNTHLATSALNYGGVYYMTYSQTKC